ncbi:MAG TPA: hypothetical protein ENN44_01035 [Methanoculleus sp.]|nr:hypothetical protein [Methanoculleus sp.]
MCGTGGGATDRRTLSLILFAGSAVASVLFWMAGLPLFFLFLFIPLIPFAARPHRKKKCPLCGWETGGAEDFCPWDGSPLGPPE